MPKGEDHPDGPPVTRYPREVAQRDRSAESRRWTDGVAAAGGYPLAAGPAIFTDALLSAVPADMLT